MDNVSKKIALLERKKALLEAQRKEVNKELKEEKKKCNHKFLLGGIVTSYDENQRNYNEIYYCLSCGTKILKSNLINRDYVVMIDIKDYITYEEYISYKFVDLFNEYYDLAKKRLNEMILNDIPDELIEAALSNELVSYLEEKRNKDRGR